MANPQFPSLSIPPDQGATEQSQDATISTPTEAGYTITRARFSRLRRTWSLTYSLLPITDRNTLDSFVRQTVVGCAGIFDWTDPVSGNTYTVRFKTLPKFTYAGYPWGSHAYNVSFELEEV